MKEGLNAELDIRVSTPLHPATWSSTACATRMTTEEEWSRTKGMHCIHCIETPATVAQVRYHPKYDHLNEWGLGVRLLGPSYPSSSSLEARLPENIGYLRFPGEGRSPSSRWAWW